jgi:hypothetical protein
MFGFATSPRLKPGWVVHVAADYAVAELEAGMISIRTRYPHTAV